jgi:hypothetical protein
VKKNAFGSVVVCGLSAGLRENIEEMLGTVRTAGGDDGDGRGGFHGIDQFDINPFIGAIPVDAI